MSHVTSLRCLSQSHMFLSAICYKIFFSVLRSSCDIYVYVRVYLCRYKQGRLEIPDSALAGAGPTPRHPHPHPHIPTPTTTTPTIRTTHCTTRDPSLPARISRICLQWDTSLRLAPDSAVTGSCASAPLRPRFATLAAMPTNPTSVEPVPMPRRLQLVTLHPSSLLPPHLPASHFPFRPSGSLSSPRHRPSPPSGDAISAHTPPTHQLQSEAPSLGQASRTRPRPPPPPRAWPSALRPRVCAGSAASWAAPAAGSG